jgi:hypothetical protein
MPHELLTQTFYSKVSLTMEDCLNAALFILEISKENTEEKDRYTRVQTGLQTMQDDEEGF